MTHDLELIGHRMLDDENIDLARKLYRRLNNDDKAILKFYLIRPFSWKLFLKKKLIWVIAAILAPIATAIGTGLGKELLNIILGALK